MSFWGELKRRNVFKVGAAYLIAAWLILQVASITFPALNLPEWALTFLTVFLIIGFIVAIILAWAYEVTPDGVKLTKKVPLADSITNVTGRKLNYLLGGLLVVAVGYIIIIQFFINKPLVPTEVASTVSEQTPAAVNDEEVPKTIAVLPFDDLSPEKDQEYFVDGLSEEILNSLTQIPGLTVIAKTSSFSFKGKDKTIPEIASILGVDHILEGSVRKAGDALRITAQLVKAADGSHIWSKTYDKDLSVKEIFAVQEDIANSVADKLKLTLEAFNLVGGTDNVDAYELYLAAKGPLNNPGESWTHAYESIKTATEIDPGFALAWALKGFYQAAFATLLANTESDHATEMDKAENFTLKAIELEPNLPEAYIVLGHINTTNGIWIEAASAFQKAINLKSENLWGLEVSIGVFYGAVGHFEKARKKLEKILNNDPLSQAARMHLIFNLVCLGDMERASAVNRRGNALIGEEWEKFLQSNLWITLAADDVITREDVSYSSSITDTVKENLGSPEKGLSELRRLYFNENMDFTGLAEIAIWAAYFGDADFALDVMKKATIFNHSIIIYFWHPTMHEVRKMPRFKEFVREIGLVDYWEQFGWSHLCRPLDNGDFVCD